MMGLIVEGKADKPVYIWIDAEGKAENSRCGAPVGQDRTGDASANRGGA